MQDEEEDNEDDEDKVDQGFFDFEKVLQFLV